MISGWALLFNCCCFLTLAPTCNVQLITFPLLQFCTKRDPLRNQISGQFMNHNTNPPASAVKSLAVFSCVYAYAGKREAERSVNWTVEETQVLLCAWSDERVQKSLAENLRNRHVFKHLSARMSEMGFSRSPHQCRLRVKTLKANYVRAKLQRSVDSSQPCTFKYFADMDAVLGRRSAGGEGGPYFVSPERMVEHHLDSTDRSGSVPPDLRSNSEISGHHFGSPGTTGRQRLSSLEEKGARQSWQLDSQVKLEDGEDSTDEFEFSNTGFPQHLRDRTPQESGMYCDYIHFFSFLWYHNFALLPLLMNHKHSA